MTTKDWSSTKLNTDRPQFYSNQYKILVGYRKILDSHIPKMICMYYKIFWLGKSSKLIDDFTYAPNLGIFSTWKKIQYPLAFYTITTGYFDCLPGVWADLRVSLHHLVSKFSNKFENLGFWGMLPLVPNPELGTFVKNRLQTLNLSQAKMFCNTYFRF